MHKTLRLNCTKCGAFTEYSHETDAEGNRRSEVVRCDECGKRHSDDSLYMVNPDRDYDRDEAGVLLENLP